MHLNFSSYYSYFGPISIRVCKFFNEVNISDFEFEALRVNVMQVWSSGANPAHLHQRHQQRLKIGLLCGNKLERKTSIRHCWLCLKISTAGSANESYRVIVFK